MNESEIPAGLSEHQEKYKIDAWKEYSIQELGNWVHLLVKRSQQRSDPEKREKDLLDAQNYLNMIQFHVDFAKSKS